MMFVIVLISKYACSYSVLVMHLLTLERPHEFKAALDYRLSLIFEGGSCKETVLVHLYDLVKQILALRTEIPMDLLFSEYFNYRTHPCELNHAPRRHSYTP